MALDMSDLQTSLLPHVESDPKTVPLPNGIDAFLQFPPTFCSSLPKGVPDPIVKLAVIRIPSDHTHPHTIPLKISGAGQCHFEVCCRRYQIPGLKWIPPREAAEDSVYDIHGDPWKLAKRLGYPVKREEKYFGWFKASRPQAETSRLNGDYFRPTDTFLIAPVAVGVHPDLGYSGGRALKEVTLSGFHLGHSLGTAGLVEYDRFKCTSSSGCLSTGPGSNGSGASGQRRSTTGNVYPPKGPVSSLQPKRNEKHEHGSTKQGPRKETPKRSSNKAEDDGKPYKHKGDGVYHDVGPKPKPKPKRETGTEDKPRGDYARKLGTWDKR